MTDMDAETDQVLWHQLGVMNSALEPSHRRRSPVKVLEQLRDSTRTLLNNRGRPKLRPLQILDLPNELLIHIFEFVIEDRSIDEQFIFYYRKSDSIQGIQSIRLTCRRFCETSSHLLLPCIDVDMTRSSLAHFDEVSRHPSVSKGVRIIHLSLGLFYDSVLAHDIRVFVAYHATLLREIVGYWRTKANGELAGETPPEVYRRAISKAVPLAESWEELAAWGISTIHADHLMILNAYEQYLQLYEDYVDFSCSFTQAITSAMMRMPTATRIKISDTTMHGPSDLTAGYPSLGTFDQHDSLLKHLLSRTKWSQARKHGLGQPPFHLIGELLCSIQQLELPLEKLHIGTPLPLSSPSTSNTVTTHEQIVLHRALKGLKTLRFQPPSDISDDYWTETTLDKWAYFPSLLLSLLHTKSLQTIYINLSLMVTHDRPPQFSMAFLLLSYKWPNLQRLYFNGPFHFEELRLVVQHLGQNVELHWSGYLMSGSWADVLDLLRGRNTPRQLIGDVYGSVYGQECDLMDVEDMDAIFGKAGSWRDSKAILYIQGRIPSNPVTAWEMDGVDMPSPSDDGTQDEQF